jgi:hypothetical protein
MDSDPSALRRPHGIAADIGTDVIEHFAGLK